MVSPHKEPVIRFSLSSSYDDYIPGILVFELAFCADKSRRVAVKRKYRIFALLALCEGKPPVTDGFPSQRVSCAGMSSRHHESCKPYQNGSVDAGLVDDTEKVKRQIDLENVVFTDGAREVGKGV